MANIKISKIDENKSKPSNSNPYYVLVLSEQPDQNWKNRLHELEEKKRNSGIMNLRVEHTELTFTTRPDMDIEQAISVVQELIKEVNGADDEFKNKIREINKKLSEES